MSSLDESSFDEKERVIEQNRKEKNIHEGLGNNKEKVQLEIEEQTFEPKWKSDVSNYFRGVKKYDLSYTNKCEKRCKKELEKSASHSQLIVDIFWFNIRKISCII